MSSDARLWQRLTVDASRYHTRVSFWAGNGYQAGTWPEVVRDAECMTAGLRRAGVERGSRVAVVLTNGPHAARGLLAVWLAGGVVASLPTRVRGMDPVEYGLGLSAVCEHLGAELLLADEQTAASLPEESRPRLTVRTFESFAGSGRVEPAPPADDEPAFIQYSSGSTSAPKGCVLTPRAIANQLDLLAELVDARPGEVGVGWLPWSHDMGLFGGLLTGWWNATEAYFSTPERFVFSPRTWFEDMARFGATITAGSPTALHLAAVAAGRSRRMADGLRVRSCIVGAERVRWDTLRGAVARLAPHGFTEEALMPAYGMAEATLAVTATPLAEKPRFVAVDGIALADGDLREVAPDDPVATRVVSAGPPVRGVTVSAGDAGRMGEIQVRSASLATGYHRDPERTAAQFQDGTLFTGDLGFVRDGYLYPVGRLDDLISIGGRNVYAREIESAVDGLAGVRFGSSTLVGQHDDGAFRLTLFVEVASRRVDHRGVTEQAATIAMAKAAVVLDECVFLERNALPRTPSGKIQRHRCRQLLDLGRFEPVATVRLGPVSGGTR